MVEKEQFSKEEYINVLNEYNTNYNEKSLNCAIRVINNEFFEQSSRYTLHPICKYEDNIFRITSEFKKVKDNKDFRVILNDLLGFSLFRFNELYKNKVDERGFKLYSKYTRSDVCRILNWNKDEHSTMYGYRIKNNTCPIFVTYNKKDDISASTKYEDEFIDENEFSWYTRSGPAALNEAKELMDNNDIDIFLFIKKSDDEGSEFYYMGKVRPVNSINTTILDDNKKEKPIVNIKMEFCNRVRRDIYEYIVE